ncbi:lamin tail domain-containing protein [Candidatus Microgenomates bacterium]|nr:lamin tail domain-containing protein [Candidatus Microgenomates bacterium]
MPLIYAQESTESATLESPTPTPIESGPSPSAEPSASPSPSPTPSSTPEPSLTQEPSPEVIQPQESTPSAASELSPEPGPSPTPVQLWTEDSGAYTTENLQLGTTYHFPPNEKVSVTFTKLPEGSGTVTVKEYDVPQTVENAGSKDYEITSSMPNGSFSFDLTLPTNDPNKKVLTSEDGQNYDEVSNETVTASDVVTIKGITHLTHFIVGDETDDPNHPVINEFLSAPSPDADQERVELYNPTSETINLNNWKLMQLSNPSSAPVEATFVPLSGDIAPKGFIIAAGSNLNDTGDWIGLYDGNGTLWDQVSFGSVVSPYNVNVVDNPLSEQSTGRTIDGGPNWTTFVNPTIGLSNVTAIISAVPNTVDSSFTPQIGSTLSRGSTAYLGRTTTYVGPDTFPVNGDSIQWRITIDGPAALTPDMVDLDEVGFDDPNGDGNSIGTYHYPFQTVDPDTIQATGSCDTVDIHDGCITDAFSLDANDVFTNADKIKFNSNAPNGSYTITYELVNTADGSVVGTQAAVTVNVIDPASIASALPTDVSVDFTPEIGSTLARGSEAYLGRTTTYTGPVLGAETDSIKWKVTITGPVGKTISPDMVDLDEVGFLDTPNPDANIATYHYPFFEESDENGNVIAISALGSCDETVENAGHDNDCTADVGFSLDEDDIFTNADKIKFSLDAPNGTYTIKYELVNTESGEVVLGTMATVSVNVTDPANIVSSNPSTVDTLLTPQIGSALARGSTAYLGRTTNYTGSALGLADPDNGIFSDTIKWRVTVDGPSSLTADMVDLDEVGFNDPGGDPLNQVTTYHYPFAVSGDNLVATGSCDAVLPSGHDEPDTCMTDIGFSLDENDVFTNADKIVFNSNAPTGSYTITYELVNTNDSSVLGTHKVIVNVIEENQTVPDSDGNATLNNTNPEVVITSASQAVVMTISSGTTNPKIDFSALISGGTGTIPQTTIDSTLADIVIPASTTVTSTDTSWNGVLAAPTVTTITLPEVSGQTRTLGSAIEIGFSSAKLSFDKGVRIVVPGEAGKRVGYSRPDTDFTEITATCAADNQATGDALATDGDCKIDSGSDLVIWTKHFTKFATYTQTTTTSSTSASDGGFSMPGASSCGDTKPGSAPTLVSAVAGTNSVTLTWSEASGPLTYYLVNYSTAPGVFQYGNPNVGGPGTTSYIVGGLSGNQTYYFKVRAGNSCAPGDYSNEISATPGGIFIESAPAAGFVEGVLGAEKEATTDEVKGESAVESPLSVPSNPLSVLFSAVGTLLAGILGFFTRLFGK